jgi:hypothetical protein
MSQLARKEVLAKMRARLARQPLSKCPTTILLVSWYPGSGERKADDVAVYGARLRRGQKLWSEPFVMADTPGFLDGNPAMFINRRQRLWLFWPIVLANTWESCVTSYRVSSRNEAKGPHQWEWQDQVLLKPEAFLPDMEKALEARLKDSVPPPERTNRVAEMKRLIDDKLFQRLGWQPRCRPTLLRSGRIVLPALLRHLQRLPDGSERRWRATWFASRPLAGYGNIQPAVLQK